MDKYIIFEEVSWGPTDIPGVFEGVPKVSKGPRGIPEGCRKVPGVWKEFRGCSVGVNWRSFRGFKGVSGCLMGFNIVFQRVTGSFQRGFRYTIPFTWRFNTVRR